MFTPLNGDVDVNPYDIRT